MKKLVTLILIGLLPLVGKSQTTPSFVPLLDNWEWASYPYMIDNIEVLVSHQNFDSLFPDGYGFNIDAMFRSSQGDTAYLYCYLDSINTHETRAWGSFQISSLIPGYVPGEPIELGVRIYLISESPLATHEYHSEFLTITPPLVTSVLDQEVITFDVFPNPAVGYVTVSASTAIATVDVIDMTGRAVKMLPTNTQVSVDDLPAGIYFVHADEASIPVKRLVIQ